MTRGFFQKVLSIFLPFLLLLFSTSGPLLAAFEEDMETLGLYYEPKDLVVSATRSPKPLYLTAENITVITAKDIEMMGAHTLVDVFANVPGFQVNNRGALGHFDDFYLQGAKGNHVLLMLDGVALNQWSEQFLDPMAIPIRNIERIEILKGPASSSWGSALGGVINIVTKSPNEEKLIGGTASFLGGERGARDTSGEFTGTVGPFGYYIYGGNLRSRGLVANTLLDQNNAYAKLRWEFPNRASILYTVAFERGIAGDGDPEIVGSNRIRHYHFLSTLALTYPLNESLDLDLSLRTNNRRTRDFPADAPNDETQAVKGRENDNGASAKLTWRKKNNTLVAGFDYDHLDIDADPNLGFGVKLISDKYGVFLNDTLLIGDFAVTPGFRYDRMRPVGDFLSPSLGVAWNPTDKITLRAYGARGYSLPSLNPDSTQNKVITLQTGFETTYIPWLWLKTTFFWNWLSDVTETLEKQRRHGVELEARTVPIYNTSLSAGYTFTNGRDRDNHERLVPFPRQLVKLGVHYNDVQHSFRGALLGRYVCGDSQWSTNAKNSAMIMDLNLAKKVYSWRDIGFELFFNAHNIFNGAQDTLDNGFKHSPRWFEGGLKFEF